MAINIAYIYNNLSDKYMQYNTVKGADVTEKARL